MTLEQLRIFLAVAETLNMRQASERLHLTQPAVSAAIAALEARHGTQLFDRVGRRIELNAAGLAFRPEARAVLARAEEAQRVLDDLAGLVRGEVRIAASQTVATYWLPARIARFAARYPGIEVGMSAGNTAQAVEALQEMQIDEVLIVGVAKGVDRKAGLEVLIRADTGQELTLPRDSSALHLIQHIRDEAHRFAVTGHKMRRDKARRTSTLEEIPGVGPKRRKELLRHFGGLQGVIAASVDDLGRVPGISAAMAGQIHAALHAD